MKESFGERWELVSDGEYLEFDRIPAAEKLHPCAEICAMMKIYSLMKTPQKFDFSAEHDILFLAHRDELHPLTDDDIVYLSRCGIHYDSDNECLADFC